MTPPAADAMRRFGTVVLAMTAVYLLNVSYNLDLFYLRGAGDDSGWFAWLSANARSWPMPNPAAIGGNFLSVHMSPIFFVSTALLAPLSGLPVAVRFCLFISLWAPLLWLAVFLLLDRFPGIGFGRRCAAALLLTFNGLMLSTLGFPHIEMLMPPLGLLAIAVCGRARSAVGWLGGGLVAVLAIMVREDAGLHICLPLLAMAATCVAARDRRPMWRAVGLAAFCAAGSVLALWLQRHAVPDGGQLLGQVYLGHPPLAHVSPAGLARRLLYWATRREYIVLPLLVLLLAGLRRRLPGDRLLLLGIAAAVPWLTLSLLAVSQQAGDLWSYYCVPLVFMALWPLLLSQSVAVPPRRWLHVQIAMGALSTGAFVAIGVLPFVGDGGAHDRAPWTHLRPPSARQVAATEAALSHRQGWLFDYGAAALALGALQPGQFRAGLAFSDAEIQPARGFVRFATEPKFLTSQIAALRQVFPVCVPVDGTALQTCTGSP